MGGGVVVQVHRLDPLLHDGHAGLGGGEQHVDLVLIALAGDLREARHGVPPEGPQPGLGVVHLRAAGDGEHVAGDAVAQPAAQGHVALEFPAAQHQRLRPGGGEGAHPPDVLVPVLAVGVRGHREGALRAILQHVGDGGLERRALAPVHGMAQQRHPLRQGVEYLPVVLAAAVVHHDGYKRPVAPEPLQQPEQLLIGLVGGYDQRGLHFAQLLLLLWDGAAGAVVPDTPAYHYGKILAHLYENGKRGKNPILLRKIII